MKDYTYERGVILDKDTSERLIFQYNPEEITETNRAVWSNLTIHGIHHPRLQYTSGEGRVISFTLRLFGADEVNSAQTRDVKGKVDFLRSLLYPDVTSQSLPSRAPNLTVLSFGRLYRGIQGVLTHVNPTYHNMFTADLNPLYADVDIELVEFHVKAVDYREVRAGIR